MSGSLVFLRGVGTHRMTASACPMTRSSVDASIDPFSTGPLRSRSLMSSMYDRPSLSAFTLAASRSKPVTRKPARASSTTSGSPTYPIPTTTTRAFFAAILSTSVLMAPSSFFMDLSGCPLFSRCGQYRGGGVREKPKRLLLADELLKLRDSELHAGHVLWLVRVRARSLVRLVS